MVRDLTEVLEFSGKTAVVTGATGGNGRGIARALAAAGANLLLHDRPGSDFDVLQAELKGARGNVATVEADLARLEEVDKIVDAAFRTFGTIDFLVNNAGLLHLYDVVDMPVESWDETLSVNLRSAVFLTQKIVRKMIERRSGNIVNIGSSLSANGGAGGEGVDYNVSKAGIQCFTKTLAKQLAKYGIRVNSVSPGIIDTAMLRGNFDAGAVESFADNVPLGRLGIPDDIGNAVLFLFSDLSSYITGQAIHVNGGLAMYDH